MLNLPRASPNQGRVCRLQVPQYPKYWSAHLLLSRMNLTLYTSIYSPFGQFLGLSTIILVYQKKCYFRHPCQNYWWVFCFFLSLSARHTHSDWQGSRLRGGGVRRGGLWSPVFQNPSFPIFATHARSTFYIILGDTHESTGTRGLEEREGFLFTKNHYSICPATVYWWKMYV